MISLSAVRGMLGKWVIVMSREFCRYGLIMRPAKTGGNTTGCLNHSASAGGMCLRVLSGWLYHLLGCCLNLAPLQWHLPCLKGQLTQSSNWASVSFTNNIKSSCALCFHTCYIWFTVLFEVSTLTGYSCCICCIAPFNEKQYYYCYYPINYMGFSHVLSCQFIRYKLLCNLVV